MTLIRLPVAPSTNNLFANGKHGRFITDHYKAWRTEAGVMLNLARVEPFGRMRVELEILIPEKTRGDISNRVKATEDLLVAHKIIEDDVQVWRLVVGRHKDADMLLSIVPFQEHT